MITDGRRPPFCYQTHAAIDLIRESFDSRYRTTAFAVYLVLTETANRIGGAEARAGFRASRSSLAKDVGTSTDTLDRYVSKFVELGLLLVEKERDKGLNLPNRWVLLDPESSSRMGAASSRVGAAPPSRTGAAQEIEETDQEEGTTSPHGFLCDAWRASCPPLIGHRPAYFSDAKTKSATARALRVYPVEDVAAAIANYATCLGSPDYRWSHAWTLVDFLKRGLDKFVPEAEPLRNFRTRTAPGAPQGDDFPRLDRL